MTTSKKWYDQPLLVFFLAIVFYPLGVYAIWKSTQYRRVHKILYTVLFGICALIIWAGFSKDKPRNNMPLTEAEKTVSLKEVVANSSWISADSLKDAYSDENGYHNAAMLLDFTDDEATFEVPKMRALFQLSDIVHERGTTLAGKDEPKFTWDYDIDEDNKIITLDNGLIGDDIKIEYRDGKLYWSQWHMTDKIVFIRK